MTVIRLQILQGKVEQAIKLIDQFCPSIIRETPAKTKDRTEQGDVDMNDLAPFEARQSTSYDPEDDLYPSTSSYRDNEASDARKPGSSLVPQGNVACPGFPHENEHNRPAYLLINLLTQSFIEQVRALGEHTSGEKDHDENGDVDLSSLTSSIHSEFASSDGGHGTTLAPFNDLTGKAMAITTTSTQVSSDRQIDRSKNGNSGLTDPLESGSGKTSRTLECLTRAQNLYTLITEMLPGSEADEFVKAVEEAGALLVYKNMKDSPLRGWLSLNRRRKLATMVNKSILGESSRSV